jgi:cation:H+ antiporter
MPDLTSLPLLGNAAIFLAAAAFVWFAGTRISRYADAISERTGLSHALLGLLLLAGVTSLPEIGVTVSAAATGNTQLAVNNLFGSIAMQIAVLAIVDFVVGRRALTSVVPDPSVLLLSTLNVLLLSIAIAGMTAGDVAFLGIGLWSWACLLGYLGGVWLMSQTQGRKPWRAAIGQDIRPVKGQKKSGRAAAAGTSLQVLIFRTVAAAAVILVVGFVLARTGDAIAQQTGLGSSFVGFVFLAISTSLPEFSTALAAARMGLFTMAIADILGTNMINVGLLFVVDAVAPGEPALNAVDDFAVLGAALGITLTAIFLVGVVERRDQTIFRVGYDSAAVMVFYVIGLVLLYNMR